MEVTANIPRCIGFIIDGNRRWANRRGLPALKGHFEGYQRVKELPEWLKRANIPNAILYVFSHENWKREEKEVSYLMGLLRKALARREIAQYQKKDIRLRIVGERERLPKDIQKLAEDAETATRAGKSLTLALAISYSGRREILAAIQRLLARRKTMKSPEEISEELLAQHLWTYDVPDPDMIIRTGGERRMSNFLPWQSIYSELFFISTFWPDFSEKEFLAILSAYQKRERRFGV